MSACHQLAAGKHLSTGGKQSSLRVTSTRHFRSCHSPYQLHKRPTQKNRNYPVFNVGFWKDVITTPCPTVRRSTAEHSHESLDCCHTHRGFAARFRYFCDRRLQPPGRPRNQL